MVTTSDERAEHQNSFKNLVQEHHFKGVNRLVFFEEDGKIVVSGADSENKKVSVSEDPGSFFSSIYFQAETQKKSYTLNEDQSCLFSIELDSEANGSAPRKAKVLVTLLRNITENGIKTTMVSELFFPRSPDENARLHKEIGLAGYEHVYLHLRASINADIAKSPMYLREKIEMDALPVDRMIGVLKDLSEITRQEHFWPRRLKELRVESRYSR